MVMVEGMKRRDNKNCTYVSISFSSAANCDHLIGNSTLQKRTTISPDPRSPSTVFLIPHYKSHQWQIKQTTCVGLTVLPMHVLSFLSPSHLQPPWRPGRKTRTRLP